MRNPWMSMWLSAFNRSASTARGHALAQMNRQYQSAMTEGTRQMMQFWSGGLLSAAPKKRREARKR